MALVYVRRAHLSLPVGWAPKYPSVRWVSACSFLWCLTFVHCNIHVPASHVSCLLRIRLCKPILNLRHPHSAKWFWYVSPLRWFEIFWVLVCKNTGAISFYWDLSHIALWRRCVFTYVVNTNFCKPCFYEFYKTIFNHGHVRHGCLFTMDGLMLSHAQIRGGREGNLCATKWLYGG